MIKILKWHGLLHLINLILLKCPKSTLKAISIKLDDDKKKFV